MNAPCGKNLKNQSGVALVALMLAVFILTVVVAGLTLATMGETGLSFDQSRSGRAFQVAEAGAYRALAGLRRRMFDDLNANIANARVEVLRGLCEANAGWQIIASYGGPNWNKDDPARTAVLNIGTQAAPILLRDAQEDAAVFGSFYATIYVRSPLLPDTEKDRRYWWCTTRDAEVQSFTLPFDYFVASTGVVGNATRTICLKNSGNLVNCGAWLDSADRGDDQWNSNPPEHVWVVRIESAPYSRWALMLLKSSNTWLTDTSDFPGPVHSNDQFRIWGGPVFHSTVTQVGLEVTFGNGGNPIELLNDKNPPYDEPRYEATRMQRGWCARVAPDCAIDPPDQNKGRPDWLVLGDSTSYSSPPVPQDVCRRTTALPDDCSTVPTGIYFMDQARPDIGGILVQGDVGTLVLCVADPSDPRPQCRPEGPDVGWQHIIVTTSGRKPVQKTYILQPGDLGKPAKIWRECRGADLSRCTPPGERNDFSGMIYVNGSILRDDGGLYGQVQRDTALSIVASGEIWITYDLKYQERPDPDRPYDPANVLGLYAWCANPAPGDPYSCADGARDVVVAGRQAPNDLEMNASVLVPWGEFYVKNWDTLPDKGILHFLGGTVQATFGEWGGFVTDQTGKTTRKRGYGRDMTYDGRFRANIAPPFFPVTKTLTADRKDLDPDPLYDRPLWEELTSQPPPP